MTGHSSILWSDALPEPRRTRPSLESRVTADVCIIGAGYTGLWTAYYLKQRAPQTKVVILEAEIAGFGASGRNGGWVSGSLAKQHKYLDALSADDRRIGYRVIFDMVDEVGRVIAREGIHCDYHKGGVLYAAARYAEQETRLRRQLEKLHADGCGEGDYHWLGRDQARDRIAMRDVRAAIFSPHCAVVQPARLVHGLADVVERLGVSVYENSPVTVLADGEARTAQGVVAAPLVVTAMEGYSNRLPKLRPYMIPVHSLIVATEPLDDAAWRSIGLHNREAFDDSSRQITYGQRTADGRMIFGARGKYYLGGRQIDAWPMDHPEFRMRVNLLHDLFPQLRGVRITHGWGGSFGMARAMAPHVIFDRARGHIWGGGYTGEGVAASNLVGRTITDLILERESELLRMPWVFRNDAVATRLRSWEPEPFRWFGSRAISLAFRLEDQVCRSTTAPGWRKRAVVRLGDVLELLMR
ncbi:MAG: FAD-dependent oxidoreductase [Gammaproteobacteria bacterium]|nr:FAD-dependent oxidoreductase [Gammaproteobacteria bacterium]